jgi:hypothetical protein
MSVSRSIRSFRDDNQPASLRRWIHPPFRAIRRSEIEDLRTRLDRLESDEKSKTNRRDEVIDQRFQQLVR